MGYKATWAAERFLKHWTKSALLSRLEPMRKFVHALHKPQQAVVAIIDNRVTNAIAEGTNRIVRMSTTGPVAAAISTPSPT